MERKGTVCAGEFHCSTALKMLEKCNKCVKNGKCKERELLIAILLDEKTLSYAKE